MIEIILHWTNEASATSDQKWSNSSYWSIIWSVIKFFLPIYNEMYGSWMGERVDDVMSMICGFWRGIQVTGENLTSSV